MVKKLALPPIKLEIGSARKTPSVPRLKSDGRKSVSGMTIMTLRNREKKTACFDLPRATKVDWPENCSDIIKMPKK